MDRFVKVHSQSSALPLCARVEVADYFTKVGSRHRLWFVLELEQVSSPRSISASCASSNPMLGFWLDQLRTQVWVLRFGFSSLAMLCFYASRRIGFASSDVVESIFELGFQVRDFYTCSYQPRA
jgi:hypothetical protein